MTFPAHPSSLLDARNVAGRYVENFLRSNQSPVGFDDQHVLISVMVEIIGRTRRTLYTWTCNHGWPRDGQGQVGMEWRAKTPKLGQEPVPVRIPGREKVMSGTESARS